MRNLSLFILPLLLVLTGCPGDGTPVTPTHAADHYEVQKLFTADNCTVYRFYDVGKYHYFTKCVDATRVTTDTTSTKLVGKIYVEESNINVTEMVK